MRNLAAALALIMSLAIGVAHAGEPDRLFDDNWRFHRGDAPGAERADFDDASWRRLDLPHDWSIEDLPPSETTDRSLDAVTGDWRFRPGDDQAWKAPGLDDSDWEEVKLPASWESHSGHSDVNVYGWFRRRLTIPEELKGQDIELLLGRIDDADEVWLNGQPIGATGAFPPDYRSAWDQERRYTAPASLIRGDGSDVLAVRVFDGEGEGGIYAAGVPQERVGPFDPAQSPGTDRTGYVLGGVGWYRKAFATPAGPNRSEAGRVAVRFDGAYMIADVWINDHHLGARPHGYTSFEHELTPYLRRDGRDNVLAVRVKNEGKNSRWYSGSGLYRHVWLTVTDKLHIPTWGVFVQTPEVSADRATVEVSTEVRNDNPEAADAVVKVRVLDRDGAVAQQAESPLSVASGQTATASQPLAFANPELWSPDSPTLYTAEVEVLVGARVVDQLSTTFGVRQIEVDAERGFLINGRPLLLRGGCVHHDNGPLGAAAIDRAEVRKVELLKANGYNAIRSSHNPPSPAMLAACDRLGVLMIDEAFDKWREPKIGCTDDYSRYFDEHWRRDLASMVRRDRNHPSVIMWSIGNEIPEQFRAVDTQRDLRRETLAHDPTRLITQAICSDWGPIVNDWGERSDPAFTHLDVAGYNYLPEKYDIDHARHPDRVMLTTESFPKDAFAYWELVEQRPYVIGDFVWTAIDYLGESGLAHAVGSNEPNPFFMSWPWHNAWCGDLDLGGFKKPQSYCRDVVWRQSQIEMAVHRPLPFGVTEVLSWWGWPDERRSWNWPGHEGEPLRVSVYSRCERVRLELNGRAIGEQPVSAETNLTATFDVPYQPGELRAVGLIDGAPIAETTLATVGEAAELRLTVDRATIAADRNDLAYVTVEVVDARGRRLPDAAMEVEFSIDGVGELAGQASGAPNLPASFQQPVCTTFRGRCLAILRPTGGAGEITLQAEAPGLPPVSRMVVCE